LFPRAYSRLHWRSRVGFALIFGSYSIHALGSDRNADDFLSIAGNCTIAAIAGLHGYSHHSKPKGGYLKSSLITLVLKNNLVLQLFIDKVLNQNRRVSGFLFP
jgi:hypothetical protein